MNGDAIAEAIATATGIRFENAKATPMGGGCINHACMLEADGADARFFVKTNAADTLSMFEAEADALRAIAATDTVRVPDPICHGTAGADAFLVLEFVPLSPQTAASQATLGRQLAALHQCEAEDGRFGWRRDNTIGITPQINTPTESWASFFAEHRIGFQLELAARRGHRFDYGDRLVGRIPHLLADHAPAPSLLHGDLWAGNASSDDQGQPVLYDPASYFGDRETDLAFMEMFGGFGAPFRSAYEEVLPPLPGYPLRKRLYNLYHLLNHHNIFGGGYTSQAGALIRELAV